MLEAKGWSNKSKMVAGSHWSVEIKSTLLSVLNALNGWNVTVGTEEAKWFIDVGPVSDQGESLALISPLVSLLTWNIQE